MVTDLVADMLTRIRNSYSAKHRYTVIAFSKLNWNIARILKQEGFMTGTFRSILIFRIPKGGHVNR